MCVTLSSSKQEKTVHMQATEISEEIIKQSATKLFEHMSKTWEEQRPAYVIAQNLFYLTYYVEPDQEIST